MIHLPMRNATHRVVTNMSLFAEYQPDDHGSPMNVAIHTLTPNDVSACADLAAEREGGDVVTWSAVFERRLALMSAKTFVASAPQVVGYGNVEYLDATEHDGWFGAPNGWYLTGLVVAPDWRRHGVGRALTLARLDWVRARTQTVWFFANTQNGASIKLHEGLGFVQVTTDFNIGVPFTGGTGVLCRLDL